jgi:hypothetical protein
MSSLSGSLARVVTYQLMSQYGQPLTGPYDVKETNVWFGPKVGAFGSVWKGGHFDDWLQGGRGRFHENQTFQARTLYNGVASSWTPLFVRGLNGQDYATLSIWLTPSAVIINGDDGMITNEDGTKSPHWCP